MPWVIRIRLPPWVTWPQRPFPDASLLLLPGANPALAGSGFAGHAGRARASALHRDGLVDLDGPAAG